MKRVVWVVSLLLVATAAGVAIYLHRGTPAVRAEPVVALAPEPPEASAAAVRTVCAACHEFPAPESFPRRFWRQELKEAYDFFHDSDLQLDFPPFESTVRFYEARAPESLPKLPHTAADDPTSALWTKTTYDLPGDGLAPAVTNVNLVHLSDRHKLDVLVCDARRDELLLLQPYLDQAKWRSLGHLPAPCHTEVVDLDGDGIPDILVACLGSFVPTDDRVGSVVWLRGRPDGTY
ncbi:MAG TPA: VCBS repeat-containing protein, partial [Gemmataceae bacterium]|nr:VCBS repeat-containing protein [Gemmataceae bacterium]